MADNLTATQTAFLYGNGSVEHLSALYPDYSLSVAATFYQFSTFPFYKSLIVLFCIYIFRDKIAVRIDNLLQKKGWTITRLKYMRNGKTESIEIYFSLYEVFDIVFKGLFFSMVIIAGVKIYAPIS